jgi:hypothetical protein
MKVSTALLALLAILGCSALFLGCESQPKKSNSKSTKAEPPVGPCLKAAEASDKTILVIQWQRQESHQGRHGSSYFTFRYTPRHDDPASYESVRAFICERYVTSHTPVEKHYQFAGKDESATKIVVDADKIVHIDPGVALPPAKDTSECKCP